MSKEQIVVLHQIVNPIDSGLYVFRSPYTIKNREFIVGAVGGSMEEIKIEETDEPYIGLVRCPIWAVNPSIINIKVKIETT